MTPTLSRGVGGGGSKPSLGVFGTVVRHGAHACLKNRRCRIVTGLSHFVPVVDWFIRRAATSQKHSVRFRPGTYICKTGLESHGISTGADVKPTNLLEK